MKKPFISIIIVSWNAIHHLKRFLPSVAATDYSNFEIILADNASSDESAKWTKANFPEVIVHTLDQNYGYCGGNNKAAEIAKGEILIFLNNDVEVNPSWLDSISKVFENPDVGAAQPKLLSFSQPEFFEYAGAAGGVIDYLGYPFCRGRIFDLLEADLGQYENSVDIFWASGAALAIRKNLFFELNGFDETFEFHMEEIDLCWRLWRSGKRIVYVPDSVVYHLGGGSLHSSSPKKTYYNFRNNWWMLMKNLEPWKFNQLIWKRISLDILAVFKELIEFRGAHSKAILLGVYDALSQPKSFIAYSGTNKIPIFKKSILFSYFVKRIKYFSDLEF